MPDPESTLPFAYSISFDYRWRRLAPHPRKKRGYLSSGVKRAGWTSHETAVVIALDADRAIAALRRRVVGGRVKAREWKPGFEESEDYCIREILELKTVSCVKGDRVQMVDKTLVPWVLRKPKSAKLPKAPKRKKTEVRFTFEGGSKRSDAIRPRKFGRKVSITREARKV